MPTVARTNNNGESPGSHRQCAIEVRPQALNQVLAKDLNFYPNRQKAPEQETEISVPSAHPLALSSTRFWEPNETLQLDLSAPFPNRQAYDKERKLFRQ